MTLRCGDARLGISTADSGTTTLRTHRSIVGYGQLRASATRPGRLMRLIGKGDSSSWASLPERWRAHS